MPTPLPPAPGTCGKAATLPDLSIRIMLRVLAEEGLDATPALHAAAMPDGPPPVAGEITPKQEFAFQRAFVAATGHRPDLWLRTGLRYRLPSYGGLGMALMTSPDVSSFIRVSRETRELDYSLGQFETVGRGGLCGLRFDVSEVPEALQEFTDYRDLGAMLVALHDLWNGRFPVHRIDVRLPSSRYLADIIGENVVFGARRTGLFWEQGHSRTRLYYGDVVLHAAYVEQYRTGQRLRDDKQELVSALVNTLRHDPAHQLSLAALAAETGTTERTLQRRLKLRGLRFRDLIDEARRGVAMEMLTATETPIAEIAWRLGFAEATGFTQAFRRWTGRPPGSVRRERQVWVAAEPARRRMPDFSLTP